MGAKTRQLPKHQRGHLSREVITQAGLSVALDEGVDKLTMKRLALELSVTPMAIYRHFENKSDLIDAVLDGFVQKNDICNHSVDKTDWAAWLTKTFSNMYFGLQTMPSVYPYLGSASRFGPGAAQVVEEIVAVLEAAGFSNAQAMQAANTLNGFVIGCAIMDNAFYRDSPDPGEAAELSLKSGLALIVSALQSQLNNN